MKLTFIHNLIMSVPEGRFTMRQIVRALNLKFSSYPWIRFRDKHIVGTDMLVSVSGEYDPDFRGRDICVVKFIHSGKDRTDKIHFYGQFRKNILFDAFTTLAHERVHLLQARKSRGCPRSYRVHGDFPDEIRQQYEYYGSNIEIDAFAHTSALESLCNGKSPVHSLYRDLFAATDPRYKRFLKKKWKHGLTLPDLGSINRLSRGGKHGGQQAYSRSAL